MQSTDHLHVGVGRLLGSGLYLASSQAQIKAGTTGFAALDRVLPGGGWPEGAVSEILYAQFGVGELSVALPLLNRLTQAGRPVAMIAPPSRLHAPQLAAAGMQLQQLLVVDAERGEDALWSAEQLLRADAAAVLLWIGKIDAGWLRRLQWVAESKASFVLLIRPDVFRAEATTSALRLRIWRQRSGMPCIDILKCRGARPAAVQLLQNVK